MEPKHEVTSVDLRALCQDLREYTGARVDKAYLYDNGYVRLKMRDFERGRIELIIEVGSRKRISVDPHEFVDDAPERPPNFARMLRNRLAGATFTDIDQHEFDRIVRLEFERDDEQITVVAEFFGDGNLAVLDASGTVIDALHTIRLKSRTVAPGSRYQFPDARLVPFDLDRDRFEAHLRDSDADIVRTLATQLNLGGTYAEELCTRADVDGNLQISSLTDDILSQLYHELAALGERLKTGTFDPEIVRDGDQVIDVTPVPLAIHEAFAADSFASMNEAVATYFHHLERDQSEDGEETDGIATEIAKYERMITQQSSAIADFEEEESAMRDRAEALYAGYDIADEIIGTVQEARNADYDWDEIRERISAGAEQGLPSARAVQEITDDGMIRIAIDGVTVPVDPRHNVERNADRLYKEAKRIAEKRDGAEEALAESKSELVQLEERREAEQASESDPSDGGPALAPEAWLERESIPIRSSEDWYERFRWFRTSDGFLVIGGRNADQNEELVKKYMEPGDRFVHAQAHGGPVTLLKATEPSEPSRDVDFPSQTIEQAAQFAVSYSSVWKAGQFAGEAYHVAPDQVSKEPESGEYLQKGGFVIRGDRSYLDAVPAKLAIGISCEPVTRVIGGPPDPIRDQAAYAITVEPGNIAQSDVAKRMYRQFRESFTDNSFVRRVASPDLIQEFLPPGHSRILEE